MGWGARASLVSGAKVLLLGDPLHQGLISLDLLRFLLGLRSAKGRLAYWWVKGLFFGGVAELHCLVLLIVGDSGGRS